METREFFFSPLGSHCYIFHQNLTLARMHLSIIVGPNLLCFLECNCQKSGPLFYSIMHACMFFLSAFASYCESSASVILHLHLSQEIMDMLKHKHALGINIITLCMPVFIELHMIVFPSY